MLERMTPQQIEEWRAAIDTECVDDRARVVAFLIATLAQMFAPSEEKGKKADPMTAKQVMQMALADDEDKKPVVNIQSDEAIFETLKRAYGR